MLFKHVIHRSKASRNKEENRRNNTWSVSTVQGFNVGTMQRTKKKISSEHEGVFRR